MNSTGDTLTTISGLPRWRAGSSKSMEMLLDQREFIERYCMRGILSTYDPYDIWKTGVGYHAKALYNRHPLAGLLPAAILTLFDIYLNNTWRFGYRKQEYPIVRAFAVLSLLNLYGESGDQNHLPVAKEHLDWLKENTCAGYTGACWGLGFRHTVSPTVAYGAGQPLITITAYPLEAFIAYSKATDDHTYDETIRSVYAFLRKDLHVMEETETTLATSYGPFKDRVVTNAVSYAMYSYALLLTYIAEHEAAALRQRVRKLYGFIHSKQRDDGSWLYSPEGNSFIDCFHSCIIIKNILKTESLCPLPEARKVAETGYRYLKDRHWDSRHRLFMRFSLHNKPSIVRFDLYDNAEALNLALLLQDHELADLLKGSILKYFDAGMNLYLIRLAEIKGADSKL